MDNITIGRQLAQGLLNYLQTRPYVEVFQLIEELIAAANSPTENEESKKTK